MKAYWINAAEQTITEVDCSGLKDLQRMVNGHIEAAKYWETGDVLFVDDEGLLKGGTAWFRITGKEQPIRGNGVVIGPEDNAGDTQEPTFSLAQLQAEVSFPTDAQVAAWAKANSSDPAVSWHFSGRAPIVVARIGELYV